jgi:hypothetical protein
MPTEQDISEMEANHEGTARADATPMKQASGRGCNFLVALARKAHRSKRQVAPASRGRGQRLLKCVPVGRRQSKISLSSPVVTETLSEREACEQLQDALQSSSELPEQVEDKEQQTTDVAASEQTSEEQEFSASSLPETSKQFALVATSLPISERSNWLSPAWHNNASALDKRLAGLDLAEKACDQELSEVSADTEASALPLAEVGSTREEAHVVNNRHSQAQPRKASLAVATLLPSALQGLKRAASLAQKAKEHVQKTTGDMIDVELAYVPV